MRNMRYFALMAVLLFLVVGYKTYEHYTIMETTRQEMLRTKGKTLSAFLSSFWETYQKAFTEHHIPVDDQTFQLLPQVTTATLSKILSQKLDGDVQIRTVSDRARNPTNQADPFEKKMIDFFRAHPDIQEKTVSKDDAFYYVHPLTITPACLKCHGKPEEAPQSIRKRYTRAYDYKIGDVRGIVTIRISRKRVAEKLFSDFSLTVIGTVFVYMLLLLALYAVIHRMSRMEWDYARKLEKEVEQATEKIAKQKETFETLFEKSSDGIFLLENQRIIQCNEKVIDMLRYDSKADLIGQRPAMLSPEYQPDGRASLEKGDEMSQRALANGRQQFEWVHVRKGGEAFVVDVTLMPITLDDHRVLYVVWRDISKRKIAEEKLLEQKKTLHYQAHHDALTGLPNRSLLMDRLHQGVKRAHRNGTYMVVFFIDVDNFKKINDTLGHHIGDQVLIRISERLATVVRGEDTLARLGGDEFTIVTECSVNTKFASRLAQDILDIFHEPMTIEGHTLHLTSSIGISVYPQDAVEVNDLLKYADAAMYQAKYDGKNLFRFYSPEMTRTLLERVNLETELRHALAAQEFRVYYQPQWNVVMKKVTGLEALIRWYHPVRGIIMPDTFIPLAEETGLIIEIDRWVMTTAMEEIRSWREEGLDPGVLSLNLSMQALMCREFIPHLHSTMDRIGFEPSWLEMEVTDREMMLHPDQSIRCLQQLSDMGIAIAIDDFGVGYSSLSHLKKLPVDKLKIDRSFIQGVVDNHEDASITRAVIALARSLNLHVIAEGVETSDQADFLVENGCPDIQGYYFGKPMPGEAMRSRL